MTHKSPVPAFFVLAVALSVMLPSTALPCGPGVHVRESDAIWAKLVEEYPEFKDLEDTPFFDTYLHLGAIMPDFQWFLPIKQGHGSDFSVYLVNQSLNQDPRFELMALGHLMHNSVSDPLCEQFWTPTLMSSAPLGMVSLLEGYSDAAGMSEGVTEVFGDPIVGDWDALIDAIYDIYMDGEEAKARGHEAIVWYVDSMNAYYGTSTDAEAVWQGLADKIGQYESYISGFDRQGAKDFFHQMKGETPLDMFNFLTGDLIASVAGDAAKRNADYDINVRTVLESALVDQSFWDIYEDTLLSTLTGFWYVDRIDGWAETMAPEDTGMIQLGWPGWNRNPIIAGNVMSTMQFLPEYYDVIPGLIVQDVAWTTGEGQTVSKLTTDLLGSTLKLKVTYYTAYDFTGEITLRVRGDLPGFNQEFDPTAGEATQDVSLDPRTYVSGSPSVIETEFQPGAAIVDGYYFELSANGGQPWFTSNWDTITASGKVPVYQAIYRDNFATYGKWPASLPVSGDLLPDQCEVMVMARAFADGGPVPGSAVSLIPQETENPSDEPRTLATPENGLAAFDLVGPGSYQVTADTPQGYVAADSAPADVSCDPATARRQWVTRQFHVVPKAWVTGGISGRNDCVVFNTNNDDFWSKAEKFEVTIKNFVDDSIIVPEVEKSARARIEVCFPAALDNGTTIVIHLVPKYVNGLGLGVEGVSDPILIDSTVPIVDLIDFAADGDTCDEGAAVYPFTVSIAVSSATSAIAKLELATGDDQWTELEFTSAPGEIPYTEMLTTSFDAGQFEPGDVMLFRVTNGAGIATEAPAAIPESLACPVVTEPGEDLGGTDVTVDLCACDMDDRDVVENDLGHGDTAATDVTEATDTGRHEGGGGCAAGGNATNTAGLLLLLLAMTGVLVYRRRSSGIGRN